MQKTQHNTDALHPIFQIELLRCSLGTTSVQPRCNIAHKKPTKSKTNFIFKPENHQNKYDGSHKKHIKMAKFNSTTFGTISGRHGSAVAATQKNGTSYLRVFRAPSDPKTAKQVNQRAKFGFANQAVRPFQIS